MPKAVLRATSLATPETVSLPARGATAGIAAGAARFAATGTATGAVTDAATILATATGLPAFSATQEEVKAVLRRQLPLEPRRMDAVMAIFDHALVERRYSVQPIAELGRRRSLGEATAQYRTHAIALGADVAARCLQAARLDAADIDLLITVSCTGIMIPSLDAHLVGELGFRPDVRRLPITELGCTGGAAALARGRDFIRGFPDARVMVIAVELPSLTLQRTDLSPANLVSSALFGDGAAAVILSGGGIDAGARGAGSGGAGRGDHDRDGGAGGVRILETLSHVFPRSTGALGFDLCDDGFHPVLSRDVPDILRAEAGDLIARLAARAGLTRDQLSCYVLHPGGRKILAALEDELGLPRAATQPSWDVLRDYGNQSSASVLFVLHEWLTKRHPPAGAHGLLAAFGPGLSAEMLLLRWN